MHKCSIGFVLWLVRSWFKTGKVWSGRSGNGGIWHNTLLANYYWCRSISEGLKFWKVLIPKGHYSKDFYPEGSLLRRSLSQRVVILKIFILKGCYSKIQNNDRYKIMKQKELRKKNMKQGRRKLNTQWNKRKNNRERKKLTQLSKWRTKLIWIKILYKINKNFNLPIMNKEKKPWWK